MRSLAEFVAGKQIALVGNAMSILDRLDGKDIDSHDIVIRINLGIPDTHQPGRPRISRLSVGWRTDIWATARFWPDVLPKETQHICWMKLTKTGRIELRALQDSNPHCPITTWPQELETECKTFVGADPSTGIRMLWWLDQKTRADCIHTFGMDCWRDVSHWSGRRNTPNHDPQKELQAMVSLGYGP